MHIQAISRSLALAITMGCASLPALARAQTPVQSAARQDSALQSTLAAPGSHVAPVDSTPANSNSTLAATTATNWFTRYPWNGLNVWAGSAVETRTASHNEVFNGAMRIIGIQLTRDVWRGSRARLTYVGEFLPALLVTSGASAHRYNLLAGDGVSARNGRLARYTYRDSYGVGLAPFGAEFSARVAGRVSALALVTAGGVLFSHIVPYGDATTANFTVSPGAALQWNGVNHTGVAVGYTLHHLSNASIGRANPGMNSHMFYLRITRIRGHW